MNDQIHFAARFPEVIPNISLLGKLLIVVLPLFCITSIILFGYSVEFIMLTVLTMFLIPFLKFNSINKIYRSCRVVVGESNSICMREESLGKYLLVDDGHIDKNNRKTILTYILLISLLVLYIIFDLTNAERTLRFLLYSLNFALLVAALSIYDCKYILKYFKTLLSANTSKIYFKEHQKTSLNLPEVPSWGYFLKKWNVAIMICSFFSVAILYVMLAQKIAYETFILIPVIILCLLALIVRDIRNIVVISLDILRTYDDHIKAKIGLVYKPIASVEKNTFIEQFKSNLKKSGYYEIDDILSKDVNDFFSDRDKKE